MSIRNLLLFLILIFPTADAADLTITDGSQTLYGTYSYDNVFLTNATIYVAAYNGTATTGTLILNVTGDVIISSSSSIIGDERGYRGGFYGAYNGFGSGGEGNGAGTNGSACNSVGNGGGGGGGYASAGGTALTSTWGCIGGTGGSIQGTYNGTDIAMGAGAGGGASGQGGNGGNGSSGGGMLTINAKNIIVNGTISFNGGVGGVGSTGGTAGAGAAGGGILLNASNNMIFNNAIIRANGGLGGSGGGGGWPGSPDGSGGRIKIFGKYVSTTVKNFSQTFSATSGVTPINQGVYILNVNAEYWDYAGDTLPSPTNLSWIDDNTSYRQLSIDGKFNTITNDSSIWETRRTTAHNQTDFQMYKYTIDSVLTTFNITWTGYGDINNTYNVTLYIWKNSTQSWEQLSTTPASSYTTLIYNFASAMTDYKDANKSLYLVVGAKHRDYPVSWISHSVSGGTVYASASDPDGIIEYNYCRDNNGVCSGWTNATSWYSGQGSPPAPGCGAWNYYYYHVQAREYGVYTTNDSISEGTYGGGCKSSCGFFYTWNGTGFIYQTDIAGASLIGTPTNHALSQIIPTARFYDIKNLEPKDGMYNLKVREVLPEADFFDMAKLIVVDVPIGYNVYHNWLAMREPFGVGWHKDNGILYNYSNTIQLLSVKNDTERTPINAYNKTKYDVTDRLQNIDNYPVQESINETQEYILDFGIVEHPENAKLIISAWVNYVPMKSALRLPIFLSVINKSGEWERVADLGSFTGDLETQAYNISNIWITNDHRIKLTPSYSKTLAVIIDKISIDDSTPINTDYSIENVNNADLHYRGSDNTFNSNFEHRVLSNNVVIEERTKYYFYGNFTKYGDVTPLLNKIDDKYVIMRHGDEMDLTFYEIPLKNNTERRYFLYALDWYAAMRAIDNNKTFIRDDVNILPFVNMTEYPYNISKENYPYDDEHIAYISEYNTRECNDRINFSCKDKTTGKYVFMGTLKNKTLYQLVIEILEKYLSMIINLISPEIKPQDEDELKRSLNTNYLNVAYTIEESVIYYIPPVPASISATTGNFFVNTSVTPGSGNVTDGYNFSINGVWYNVTVPYVNLTLLAHGWGNATVYAWNSSGILSPSGVSLNTQIPNNLPVMTGNAITPVVANLTSGFNSSTHTATDADSDTVTFSYLWYKDNVSTGITTSTLSSSLFLGSRYKVFVTPNDGYGSGTGTYSNEVRITTKWDLNGDFYYDRSEIILAVVDYFMNPLITFTDIATAMRAYMLHTIVV